MTDHLAAAAAGVRLGERQLAADSERAAFDLERPAPLRIRARKLTLISIEE